MKCKPLTSFTYPRESLPVRGAWIEISNSPAAMASEVSLPVRGAWIEIRGNRSGDREAWSLPVRGAWIEMVTLTE